MTSNPLDKYNIFGLTSHEFSVIVQVFVWINSNPDWLQKLKTMEIADLYTFFTAAANELNRRRGIEGDMNVSEEALAKFVSKSSEVTQNMKEINNSALLAAGGSQHHKNKFTRALSASLAALSLATVPGATTALAANIGGPGKPSHQQQTAAQKPGTGGPTKISPGASLKQSHNSNQTHTKQGQQQQIKQEIEKQIKKPTPWDKIKDLPAVGKVGLAVLGAAGVAALGFGGYKLLRNRGESPDGAAKLTDEEKQQMKELQNALKAAQDAPSEGEKKAAIEKIRAKQNLLVKMHDLSNNGKLSEAGLSNEDSEDFKKRLENISTNAGRYDLSADTLAKLQNPLGQSSEDPKTAKRQQTSIYKPMLDGLKTSDSKRVLDTLTKAIDGDCQEAEKVTAALLRHEFGGTTDTAKIKAAAESLKCPAGKSNEVMQSWARGILAVLSKVPQGSAELRDEITKTQKEALKTAHEAPADKKEAQTYATLTGVLVGRGNLTAVNEYVEAGVRGSQKGTIGVPAGLLEHAIAKGFFEKTSEGLRKDVQAIAGRDLPAFSPVEIKNQPNHVPHNDEESLRACFSKETIDYPKLDELAKKYNLNYIALAAAGYDSLSRVPDATKAKYTKNLQALLEDIIKIHSIVAAGEKLTAAGRLVFSPVVTHRVNQTTTQDEEVLEATLTQIEAPTYSPDNKQFNANFHPHPGSFQDLNDQQKESIRKLAKEEVAVLAAILASQPETVRLTFSQVNVCGCILPTLFRLAHVIGPDDYKWSSVAQEKIATTAIKAFSGESETNKGIPQLAKKIQALNKSSVRSDDQEETESSLSWFFSVLDDPDLRSDLDALFSNPEFPPFLQKLTTIEIVPDEAARRPSTKKYEELLGLTSDQQALKQELYKETGFHTTHPVTKTPYEIYQGKQETKEAYVDRVSSYIYPISTPTQKIDPDGAIAMVNAFLKDPEANTALTALAVSLFGTGQPEAAQIAKIGAGFILMNDLINAGEQTTKAQTHKKQLQNLLREKAEDRPRTTIQRREPDIISEADKLISIDVLKKIPKRTGLTAQQLYDNLCAINVPLVNKRTNNTLTPATTKGAMFDIELFNLFTGTRAVPASSGPGDKVKGFNITLNTMPTTIPPMTAERATITNEQMWNDIKTISDLVDGRRPDRADAMMQAITAADGKSLSAYGRAMLADLTPGQREDIAKIYASPCCYEAVAAKVASYVGSPDEQALAGLLKNEAQVVALVNLPRLLATYSSTVDLKGNIQSLFKMDEPGLTTLFKACRQAVLESTLGITQEKATEIERAADIALHTFANQYEAAAALALMYHSHGGFTDPIAAAKAAKNKPTEIDALGISIPEMVIENIHSGKSAWTPPAGIKKDARYLPKNVTRGFADLHAGRIQEAVTALNEHRKEVGAMQTTEINPCLAPYTNCDGKGNWASTATKQNIEEGVTACFGGLFGTIYRDWMKDVTPGTTPTTKSTTQLEDLVKKTLELDSCVEGADLAAQKATEKGKQLQELRHEIAALATQQTKKPNPSVLVEKSIHQLKAAIDKAPDDTAAKALWDAAPTIIRQSSVSCVPSYNIGFGDAARLIESCTPPSSTKAEYIKALNEMTR
ncbi:MAG: hypothetical protein NkDv07_0745 [Candidatus Improbicoccus devescovinae]|nr:MAG: hypothetical protein NkDv07_0745 [Candidatus Improbicoccus devescovinae]